MSKFNAIEHIGKLNIFKNSLQGREFTSSELTEGLRECGIPSNTLFCTELRRSPLIKVTTNNRMVFAFQTPIYYKALEQVYKGYRRRANDYARTNREKKRTLETA